MTDTTDDANTYHHGDLPAALRSATAELITEKGATGFSLREVARRAGVSHSAPAHHFGDSQGLLTSVATEGFSLLVERFERAQTISDPLERLTALGNHYLDHAHLNPGHFGVMCANELIDNRDETFSTTAGRAFEILAATVAELAAKHNPSLNIKTASTFIWSSVHGLAVLLPGFDNIEERAGTESLAMLMDQFTNLIVNGIYDAKAVDLH